MLTGNRVPVLRPVLRNEGVDLEWRGTGDALIPSDSYRQVGITPAFPPHGVRLDSRSLGHSSILTRPHLREANLWPPRLLVAHLPRIRGNASLSLKTHLDLSDVTRCGQRKGLYQIRIIKDRPIAPHALSVLHALPDQMK